MDIIEQLVDATENLMRTGYERDSLLEEPGRMTEEQKSAYAELQSRCSQLWEEQQRLTRQLREMIGTASVGRG